VAPLVALERAELFFRIYQLLDEHRRISRVTTASTEGPSDALGEAARHRGGQSTSADPGAPEGRLLEQASTGIDVFDPPPLGVVAGITPFNFSDGAHVDVGAAIACGNTFILAVGEGPVASFPRRTLKEAGLPTASSTSGATSRVDAIPAAPRHRCRLLRRLDPVARYVYDRNEAGKRAGARWAKNHDRLPTPTSTWL
jgi:hypothetical protein